jgi:hypothetical protein
MIDPCKDCLINTVCSELCDQRRAYTQDINAELHGQAILYRKNLITREQYQKIDDLFDKIQKENFKIQLRGGTFEEYGSSSYTSSSSSSSQRYVTPLKKVRKKK